MRHIPEKLKKLYRIIYPFRYKAIGLLTVSVLSAASESLGLSLLLPLLSVSIYGQMPKKMEILLKPLISLWPSENLLLFLAVLFMFFIVFKSFLLVLHSYLSSSFVWKLNELWYNVIMNKYINSTFGYFVKQKQGVLISNLLNETDSSAQAVLKLIQLVSKIMLCLALYMALIFIDLRITLVLTFLFGIILLLINNFSKTYASKQGATKIRLLQEIHTQVAEDTSLFQMIKTYGLQEVRLTAFKKATAHLRKVRIKFQVVNSLPLPLGELFVTLVMVFLLYSFTSFEQKRIQSVLPLISTIILISQRLLSNFSDLMTQRMSLHFFLPSLSLVHDLTTEAIEQEDIESGLTFNNIEGDIIFKNISFSYHPDRPILTELDMIIPKGKMTAIVGQSGIGKSTIAGLLLGLFKPTSGEILINGRPLNHYSVKSLRSKMGYVSQDIMIYNTSVKENIRMGKIDASDEDIEFAAKQALIHDFVDSLPKGYDTNVGDKGVMLSGGQKQRIAIARAILRKPDIYIFDEATSSLDNESEKLIQKSIEELCRNKTVLIIAHRLSTIENADVVYDLNKTKHTFEIKSCG